MRLHLLLIGFLLLPSTLHAEEGSLTGTLYQKALFMTEHGLNSDEAELIVEEFVLEEIVDPPFSLSQTSIDFALNNQLTELCDATGDPIRYDDCVQVAKEIRELVERTVWVRSLGRDLQKIAASYEAFSDGLSGRDSTLITGLPSLVNIWQSGSDAMTNPVQQSRARAGVYEDQDDMDRLFDDVAGELNALIREENEKKDYTNLASAVHVYRHGYQDVRAAYDLECEEGDGTELEGINIRWCSLEDALEALVDELPQDLEPPLAPDETLFYPPKLLDGLGVIVWVRQDDAGIIWEFPLEPVLPTLKSVNGGIILGGDYPDAPEPPLPGEGICSHPVGARGYLCRTTESGKCPGPEIDEDDEDRIILTGCKPQNMATDTKVTESGPDICGIGGWRLPPEGYNENDTSGEDDIDDLEPNRCDHCKVDFICGGSPTFEDAIGGGIEPKWDDGRIPIYVDRNPNSEIPAMYRAMYYLVHAQQMCNNQPNEHFMVNSSNDCCTKDYPATLVMCKAMKDDGVFVELDITVEECASIFTHETCSNYRGDYSCQQFETDLEYDDIVDYLKDKDEFTVSEDCRDIVDVDEVDPRVASLRASLPRVCNPNCESRYKNTIGNNLCYIGQCIEQTIEQYRLMPSRTPFVAGGEAFPFDSCAAEDPRYGALVPIPPLREARIPSYKNREFIEDIDALLCEVNGASKQEVPALCAFDARKGISLAAENFALTIQNINEQTGDAQENIRILHLNLENIGTSMSTTLFKEFLHTGLRQFSDIVGTSAALIQQIGEAEYPTKMCPRRSFEEENENDDDEEKVLCPEYNPISI